MDMIALSVRQPWANLIACGKKTVETRVWRTQYRGQLLICSSARPAIEPAGYAVAVATLADCRPMNAGDEQAACCAVYPGAWAWVLRDVRPIRPFRVRGRLKLFKVEIPSGVNADG
jgi:hypothetical protein